MLIHSGLFVIALGFVGFFSAKSFHRYISLPVSFLLLVLALFVSDQTGLSVNFLSYDLTLLQLMAIKVFSIVFLLMIFAA